jgi:hypothetical protein
MRSRRLIAAAAAALASGALLPAQASAHGLVGKADLPVPSWLFAWAAAVVLIVSFVGLATLWQSPQLQEPHDRPLFRFGAWADVVCGAIGIFFFGLIVYSGLEGTSTATSNFAPTAIYVDFWVGLVFASALFGDVFRLFSPWRALARAFAWIYGKLTRGSTPEPLPYPAWLGRWPAVVTILAFAWLELIYIFKDDPSKLAAMSVGYAVIQLIGMSLFGIEPWSRHGDGFAAYFGLFARLSAFARRAGRIVVRRPLSGLPNLDLVPGTVALICVAIGTTTFDGLSQGSIWNGDQSSQGLYVSLQNLVGNGLGLTAKNELAASIGLVGCVAIILGLYHLGILGMRTVGGDHSTRELAGRFAHTLVPIMLAYAVAHYFSLLVYQGQATGGLLSDPLGDGSNILGTANATIDYGIISATGIWYVQLGVIVLGHVGGLALAHDRALVLYRRAAAATRSQLWMLTVMVGFTSLALFLVSAASR